MIGRTISHYKILEKLGSGGMGVVYLAEDIRLDRKVALKILPPEMVNEKRLERFTREAKAIAALDHPHIVHVYSIEEAEGIHFITMQLVEGKTLTELLSRNGLPLIRFFDLAIPFVNAVAAAHREGITHRDLKPDNIMVTADGRVKVLDFGLAKFRQELGDSGSELPTATATGEGRLVGTVHYMSPEQAEGKAIDARSDIFSLGVVFYEMLTGERPFGGDTPTAVLSSILKDNPAMVGDLRSSTPRDVSRLIHRCLAKDPVRRYQSALDLRHDLEQTKQDVDSGDALPGRGPARATRGWMMVAVTVALVGLTTTIWFLLGREDGRPFAVPRIQNAVQVSAALGVEDHPTWSPDGLRLAYEGSTGASWEGYDIWLAQIGSGDPVNLTKDQPGANRLPSWSPDGRQIAFFSDRDGEWKVYTMPAIGGGARSVLSLPGFPGGNWSAPQWSSDGASLFVSVRQAGENSVIVVALLSLESTRIVLPEHKGNVCWDLSLAPDGRRFAYVEGGSGNTEVTRLWTIPASGGSPVPLTEGRTNVWSPTWSRDGSKVFYVSNQGGSLDLWQQTISEDGVPIGDPLPLTHGLGIRSASFSSNGRKLAYSKGARVRNVFRAPILSDRPATWEDAEPVTAEYAFIEYIDVSPDGRFLALNSDRSGNQDLWLLPAEGGEMNQLTADLAPDWCPRWSPDGSQIAFFSYRTGNRDIWVVPSAGGAARQLTTHPAQDIEPSWSPDGKEIAFNSRRTGDQSVWIVEAKGGDPRYLAPGSEAEWSPDGSWLVVAEYASIYRIAKAGGERRLLPIETYTPRISPDSRSIYYSVTTGPREDHDLWSLSLETGKVSRLTKLTGRRGFLGYYFATDGRYLYFTWSEDLGDIWVMDVVPEE